MKPRKKLHEVQPLNPKPCQTLSFTRSCSGRCSKSHDYVMSLLGVNSPLIPYPRKLKPLPNLATGNPLQGPVKPIPSSTGPLHRQPSAPGPHARGREPEPEPTAFEHSVDFCVCVCVRVRMRVRVPGGVGVCGCVDVWVCGCVCVDLCYQEDTGFLQQPSTSADRTCENFEHVLLHSCRGPEGSSYSSGQRSSV